MITTRFSKISSTIAGLVAAIFVGVANEDSTVVIFSLFLIGIGIYFLNKKS